LKQAGTGDTLVALGKDDQSPEVKQAIELRQAQEMERLLYVAATRARHTLVLALDQEIFAKTNGRLQKGAQLKRLLGKHEINRTHFDALPTTPSACSRTAEAAPHLAVPSNANVQALPRLDRKTADQAVKRASEFVHKFNPSAYDADVVRGADDEAIATAPAANTLRVRSRADSPATLYGRWWHSLFETILWGDGLAAAERVFVERQARSPDAARSAKEWKSVRALFSDPVLTNYIEQATTLAHAEFPFSWSINAAAAIEGVIDLLLVDEAAGKCLVLDWKTNRITIGEEQRLTEHYRPQLSAYWKAVGEITGYAVEAGIYSTAAGKLQLYPVQELAAEWARLAKLSAEQLRIEVAPDAV
jgi:ATP-dependent exoDNAse (exonuclease V) beta subunit